MITRTFLLAVVIAFASQSAFAQEANTIPLRGQAVAEASRTIEAYETMVRSRNLSAVVNGIASAARAEMLLASYNEQNPDDPDHEELVGLGQTMQALASHVPQNFITARNPFDIELVGPLTLFLQIVKANMPSAE